MSLAVWGVLFIVAGVVLYLYLIAAVRAEHRYEAAQWQRPVGRQGWKPAELYDVNLRVRPHIYDWESRGDFA